MLFFSIELSLVGENGQAFRGAPVSGGRAPSYALKPRSGHQGSTRVDLFLNFTPV